MACSQPFLMRQKKPSHGHYSYQLPVSQSYFPCGWCLNCRVDKRNALIHRCEKEFIDKKCGAFVTFTYDDPHLVNHLKRDSKGNLVASLSKYDCKKFLDRLNKEVHKQPNTMLCNHKYKYLIVGEYGERGQAFDRPHFHALFFGLDFAVCKKLFMRAWRGQGQIDIGNIGQGAIGYVNKYLDKQIFGALAKEKYDYNGLERPFCHRSCGLGSSLYKENIDYAKEHNACYPWKGKDVPYPPYWKNKFLLSSHSDIGRTIQDFYNHKMKKPDGLSRYDLKQFQIDKAKLRERNLQRKLFDSGSPFLDVKNIELVFRPDWHKRMYKAYKYNSSHNLVRDLASDVFL